ncbi:MAG: septum formation initiator family protein [Pseudomonadota bacterium]
MGFSKKGLFRFSLIAVLFLALIIAWLSFGDRGFFHLYRMEKERALYLEKISTLEKKNQELLEEINRLRTDESYIESTARRELGLIRENETLYRFKKDQSNDGQPLVREKNGE